MTTHEPPQASLEHIDVSDERGFARHLAYRLLDDMAAALIEGRPGTVTIPRLDPLFAAITGRSLQLLADTIKPLHGAREAPDQISAPSRTEGHKENPGGTNTGACETKEYRNE
ncbi:MAG: hypothetical protein ABF545_00555 [Bifidobacterium psychraerophilum]|uniref:hypothetical protein n=1 Tax=Bifidobacterium psychraerophilum TaxID=218140 RepID=UPI0039E797FB